MEIWGSRPVRGALVWSALMALTLGCSQGIQGPEGPVGPAGPMGPAGLDGPAGVAGPMGPTGPAGDQGLQGPPGKDGLNGLNGANGLDGASGFSTLVATTSEAAGGNCATGGVKMEVGLDADRDGTLAPAEVAPALTRYVCNGAQGPAGTNGANGLDGANGFNTLVATAAEGVGANCATGGARIQVGLDANRNGALDPAEVVAALTRYVCNGQTGAQGPAGPAGASGAYGDGSAGDLRVAVGTVLDLTGGAGVLPGGANFQFRTIDVAGTLVVPSGTVLRATQDITVTGTLTVATGAADTGGGDANLGVARGSAGTFTGGVGLSALQAGQLHRPGLTGGGAGSRTVTTTGGDGGGALVLAAAGRVLIGVGGVVQANGAASVNPLNAGQGIVGGGGGGGGVVIIASKGTLTVAGAVRANGGAGSNGWDGNGGSGEGGGGGGGGGLIHLISPASANVTGVLQVNGGAAGTNVAGVGTVTAGHGGGACGGNGGNGGGVASSGAPVATPQNGAAGHALRTLVPEPATLIF